jgi:CRISPR-associated endonuclease Csn1
MDKRKCRKNNKEPNWKDTEKEFLIVEEYDDNGNIKIVKDKKSDTTGKEKRRITPLPTFEEIDLMSKKDQDKIYGKIKARTELTINNSDSTLGAYIFNSLLKNPKQKINGKLVRTIERDERQIQLADFVSGVYFVRDLNSGITRKMIKN